MEFEYEYQDAERIIKRLADEIDQIAASKHQKLIQEWSVFVFKDVKKHFKNQQNPDLSPWAAWSKLYGERQKSLGKKESNNMLKMTGKLQNAFFPTNVKQSFAGIAWYNPAKTTEGFPYAYAHDNGEESRSQLPRRSFMWLSREALDKMSDVMLNYLLEEIWEK